MTERQFAASERALQTSVVESWLGSRTFSGAVRAFKRRHAFYATDPVTEKWSTAEWEHYFHRLVGELRAEGVIITARA